MDHFQCHKLNLILYEKKNLKKKVVGLFSIQEFG